MVVVGCVEACCQGSTSLRTVVIFELHFFMIFFLSLFENNILEYMNHRALQAHTNVRGTSPR